MCTGRDLGLKKQGCKIYEVYFSGPCHIGQMLAFTVEISEELFCLKHRWPRKACSGSTSPSPSHTWIAISAFVPVAHVFHGSMDSVWCVFPLRLFNLPGQDMADS